MMIQIAYQIQETRNANSNNNVVTLLKHYLNVCVLGIFVFYCTTPLYCCDYVRVKNFSTQAACVFNKGR